MWISWVLLEKSFWEVHRSAAADHHDPRYSWKQLFISWPTWTELAIYIPSICPTQFLNPCRIDAQIVLSVYHKYFIKNREFGGFALNNPLFFLTPKELCHPKLFSLQLEGGRCYMILEYKRGSQNFIQWRNITSNSHKRFFTVHFQIQNILYLLHVILFPKCNVVPPPWACLPDPNFQSTRGKTAATVMFPGASDKGMSRRVAFQCVQDVLRKSMFCSARPNTPLFPIMGLCFVVTKHWAGIGFHGAMVPSVKKQKQNEDRDMGSSRNKVSYGWGGRAVQYYIYCMKYDSVLLLTMIGWEAKEGQKQQLVGQLFSRQA